MHFSLEIESNAYLIQDVKSSQTYKIGRISCNHGQTTVRGLEHIHDLSLRLKFVKSMKLLGDGHICPYTLFIEGSMSCSRGCWTPKDIEPQYLFYLKSTAL